MIYKEKVVLKIEGGLHTRPASFFVKKAIQYQSNIKIIFKDKQANAKSLVSILSLCIDQGSEITVEADGCDAKKAVSDLKEFVESTDS